MISSDAVQGAVNKVVEEVTKEQSESPQVAKSLDVSRFKDALNGDDQGSQLQENMQSNLDPSLQNDAPRVDGSDVLQESTSPAAQKADGSPKMPAEQTLGDKMLNFMSNRGHEIEEGFKELKTDMGQGGDLSIQEVQRRQELLGTTMVETQLGGKVAKKSTDMVNQLLQNK